MSDTNTESPIADDLVAVEERGFPAKRFFRSFASIAVVVAVILAVLAVVLVIAGASPMAAASSMWNSTFGSARSFGETVVRATPLLLIALTLIPSLRAGLYNIGAPGQIAAGGLAATVISFQLGEQPAIVAFVACALGAGIAGGLVGAFPGWLKARFRINEIISTLAMNFIVISVIGWILNGPLKGSYANLPQSEAVPENALLPALVPGTRAHWGLLLVLALIPLLWLMDRSRVGYRLRVFGANDHLSRQAGFKGGRYIVGLMALGGVGAGVAGWMQVVTVDQRLYTNVADPIGYTGLFVALLGGLTAIGSLVAAFGLGALLHGGDGLQVGAGVAPEIVQVILGLILFAYAVQRGRNATHEAHIQRRWSWKRSKRS